MRILLRVVTVLLLLSGLAYGSYAVGKYVLSEKLFGDSVTPQNGMAVVGKPRVSTMTRKVQTQGQGVQVQVLPAQDAASHSDVPSFSDLQRASKGRATPRAAPNRQRVVRSDAPSPSSTRLNPNLGGDVDNGPRISSSDSASDEPRSSRRRRRRRSSSYNDNSSSSEDATPRRRRRSRRRRSSDESRSYSRRSSNDSPRSSRSESRSERSQDTSSSSSGGNDSPVPSAESGGESPVPQPE